jgi:hypothetical protein
MIDTIFEDENMRISWMYDSPECTEESLEPSRYMMSSAAYLEDRESKTPFAIIVSFWRPDITTSATKNFCDDMSNRCLAKTPRHTDDERFMSEDTQPSEETEESTKERFHSVSISELRLFSILLP